MQNSNDSSWQQPENSTWENGASPNAKPKSTLISRNINVNGKRTSMRLEPAMWDALAEICRREKLNLHQLCGMVAGYKGDETSFTAAIRVFSVSYFRAASTEDGHRQAGHGSAFLFSAKKDFQPFLTAGNHGPHGNGGHPPAPPASPYTGAVRRI